jgi:hypothetical protein
MTLAARVAQAERAAVEAQLWAWAERAAAAWGRPVGEVAAEGWRNWVRLCELAQERPPRLVHGRPDWTPLLREIAAEQGVRPEHVEGEVARILQEWGEA